MRARILCVLTVAMVVVSAALARAEFVVYDDFNTGTAPDTALWMRTAGTGTPSVSGGSVIIDTAAMGGEGGIRSKTTFGYGSYQFVLSSFKGGNVVFGINSYATAGVNWSQDTLLLRDDGGYAIVKNSAAQVAVPSGWEPSSTPATYTFVYEPNLMEIYRDSTLLLQETDSAKIPQGASMRFEMLTYGGGKLGFDSVSYSTEAWSPVPEPSSLVLLAVGALGLLCYAWRKRK